MQVGPRDPGTVTSRVDASPRQPAKSAARRPRTSSFALVAVLAACSASPPSPAAQNSPPSTAPVRDGIAADVDSQESRSALFANWDAFLDPEGMPVVYEWSIGTAPGATDILDWTKLGGATSASLSDTDLPLGVALHVNVRALDIAGNQSAVSTSDGIVVGPSAFVPRPVGAPGPAAPIGHLAAIDSAGITWTFEKPTLCGRFVNGDWWVLGPVKVVAIHPASVVDGDRVRHGSMINPDPRSLLQGYDSAMFGDGGQARYDAARNVALGVDRTKPLLLQPGSSLVSSISHAQPSQLPQLESCAVLTCLAESPPPDAFRPPYCGTDKACRWTTAKLDLARLARLEAVDGAPQLPDLVERFQRTWLDHLPGWTGSYLHPRGNMPDYGRDLADLVGQAAQC